MRCWAEIDLDALRHNAAVVREQIGPHPRILAVVKANAYGHGMLEVAGALADVTDQFGVASVAEARTLAAALPRAGITLLAPALPDEREDVVRAGCLPPVSSFEEAAAFSALSRGKKVPIHLAIDTGMGRIGVWEEEAVETARKIRRLPGVEIAGVGIHLPVADEDAMFTSAQLSRFAALLGKLGGAPAAHCLNSAGVIRFPESAHAMARAGLMLYGSSPIAEFQDRLRPVMTLKTRVSLVRDVGPGRGISYGRTYITKAPMRVATLAAGYADGYHRRLSGQDAEVLIHGRRCPVLGRVTMDQIMVDVTPLAGVSPGDEAILFGSGILAAELAQKAGTIAWEIFTGIGSRVERIYLNACSRSSSTN